MAKRKKDQLGVVGLASAILKNLAQQRSMARARATHGTDETETPPEPKPKDTRTPEQIRASVDEGREALAQAAGSILYTLDVPARARDLRTHVARTMPVSWRGEPAASIAAGIIAAVGTAGIAGATVLRVRRLR